MKRLLIAVTIVLAASLSAEAANKHHRRPQSDVTVWNKDSKDPNVGWHTARCKNVSFMGMNMRECVTGSW